MNVVVGYESWILNFKPHQKIRNRVWLTKMLEGLVIPQGLPLRKNVMNTIFFTTKGLAIRVLIPKGKLMNLRFYKKKISKKACQIQSKTSIEDAYLWYLSVT